MEVKGLDSSILYRCNQKYYDKMLQEYGLGYSQFTFISQIYENEGLSMNELAIAGSFDKGTITKSIQKLEQMGYVRIENSEVDKRTKLLYTTDKAKDVMAKLYLLRQEWLDYLTSDLNVDEQEAYFKALGKMISKAREYNKHESLATDIKIYEFNKLSFNDYPHSIVASVYTGGCNFRCPYCNKRSLVFLNENAGQIDDSLIFDYLSQRKKVIDGICISGGEPLIHEGLEDFIKKVKALGLKVKLDTNGSNFKKLKELIDKKLVDYVTMDIKNTLDLYPLTTGLDSIDTSEIVKSINYLIEDHVDYEFRTTLVKEFHEETNFKKLGELIRGAKRYYLQNFERSTSCINEDLNPISEDKLNEIKEIMKAYVKEVNISSKER